MRSATTHLLAGAVLLGAVAVAPAARADGPSSTLTVAPFDLAAGIFNFEYEGSPLGLLSLHMGVDFLTFDGLATDGDDVFAVGPVVGLRLFPFGGAPGGLWAGPFVGLAYVRAETRNGTEEAIGTQVGAMVGVTFIPFDILVLSLGAGLAHHELGVHVDGEEIGLIGLHPRLRFALGVAF